MPPPAPSHTLARRLLVPALLAVGAFALDPGEARADCAVTVPNVIVCAPPGTGGFGTGVEDGQTITVESGATLNPVGINVRDNNVITVENGGTIDGTGGGGGNGIVGNAGNRISNAGTITVDAANDGIRVTMGDMDADTIDIQNSGTIEVTGSGVGIQAGTGDGNRDSIDVQNTGTINVTGMNGTGIAEVVGNTIDNRGEIVLSGDGTTGINAGGNAQVTNAGLIQTPMGGTADNVTGIRVGVGDGMDDSVEVLNTGTIRLQATNPMVNTVGIEAGANNFIQNDNSIQVIGEGDSPGAVAVRAGAGSTVRNNFSIQATGENVRGVELGANGTLDNNNGIQSSPLDDMGPAGPAVDLIGGAGSTNTVDNAGNIFGYSNTALTLPGIAIRGGAGDDTVVNRGGIRGNVELGAGDDVFELRTGARVEFGTLDGGPGDNELRLLGNTANGILDFNATPVLNFNTLTIDVDPDANPVGTPGGALWDLDGTATFPTAINLNRGTIQTDTVVTLNGGPFNMSGNSAIQTLVNPAQGTAGRFVFGNTADLDGTLLVLPLTPLQTSRFTVIEAAMITGGFVNTPQDTALLDFTITQTNTQVILDIVRNTYASVALTDNQRAVGGYLDRVFASGEFSPDLTGILLQLDAFEASQFPQLYDTFHPEVYDAHTGQSARIGRMIAGAALEERPWCKPSLYGLRPAQRGDVPCGPRGWSAWTRALAGFGKRDSGSDFRESHFRDQGIMGGIDWRITRNWLVSMFGGITSTDIHVNRAGEGDLDTIEIGLAGVFRLSGLRVRGAFGYGRGDHRHDREIGFFDRTAEADYDSNRILGLMSLSWVQAFGNFHLEPIAAFDVTWIQEEDISESGANALDLTIAERENTLVATSFGGRFFYRHFQNPFSDRGPGFAHGTWTPELTVKWRSIWTGADRELESRFRGAAARTGDFTIDAQDTEQGLDVGVHLLFQPHGSGGGMSIGYDGHWGDGGLYHSFGAKLRLFF